MREASHTVRSSAALVYAAQYGRSDCVEELLQAGADVNMAYSSNFTVLLAAAAANKHECLYRLLNAGADFNAKTSKENTVLHFCCSLEQCELC